MQRIPVLLIASMLNASCATLYAGHTQRVSFTSEPPGARVALDGPHLECLTPCTLNVPRSPKPINYEAAMPTREPFTGELIATPNFDIPILVAIGSFLGAFLILPGLVDIISSSYHMWPNAVAFTLPPEGQGGARVVLTR